MRHRATRGCERCGLGLGFGIAGLLAAGLLLYAHTAAAAAPAASAASAASAKDVPAPQPPAADHRKENKAVVRRYLLDVLAGAHPEAITELVSSTYRDRTPAAPEDRGPAAVRKAQSRVHEVFSKVDYMVQELIADDDRVVARYVVQATPRMKSGALPVQPVVINGITIFKLAGGKIQETWIMNDQLNMLRQLGFALAPGPSSPPSPPAQSSPPPGTSPSPANPGVPPP